MHRLLNDCLLCYSKINFLFDSMNLIKSLKMMQLQNFPLQHVNVIKRPQQYILNVERTRDKTSQVTLRPSMQQVIVTRLPFSNTSHSHILAITLGSRIRRVYPPAHCMGSRIHGTYPPAHWIVGSTNLFTLAHRVVESTDHGIYPQGQFSSRIHGTYMPVH
jgi:hypothetical protein